MGGTGGRGVARSSSSDSAPWRRREHRAATTRSANTIAWNARLIHAGLDEPARGRSLSDEVGATQMERICRALLIGSVVAGVSYVFSWSLHLPLAASVTLKGAGVTQLAVYAGLKARNLDGWLITVALAFGALGDVVLDAVGLTAGSLAFFAGHIAATALYLRNRRHVLTPRETLVVLALAPLATAAAFWLPADQERAPYTAIYGLSLALMAATAWTSAFPRERTGVGALMFAVANILIYARLGPLAHAPGIDLAIWGLYFGGQVLICLGVTGALAKLGGRPVFPAF